ncbi:MAG: 2-oxo acid dehydrogenase subunit E2, partial [Bdellovibrionales bacterium]|nr:2-oxo acid dehydrogenase subunit E2 [Bdellovibrionales bacterium]
VDLTNLVKFREGFKAEFKRQEGFNLTYSHFIMWALVKALKEYPLLNSSVEGDNIVRKRYINLGCAVSVGDGLVVPNVKDADTLNITGIAKAVDNLANKARNKKLSADDMADGTFTFTNNGSFGTLMATPIILQPQVGIYCAGAIKKTVVVMPDDSLAIRSIMYGTHTYDHRLIDGATGGRFLESVHNLLATTDFKTLF